MELGSQKQGRNKGRFRKYELAIPAIISLIGLAVSLATLYLILPIPRLEVGMFPDKQAVYSNVLQMIPINSSSNQTVFKITNVGGAHSDYNFTYQVYNSGKGVARNVNVSLMGEPPEIFAVMSTFVFVGEPLKSNLLDIVHNNYQVGLLGAGESYCFLFSVRVNTDNFTQGGFLLRVTSENAGTFTERIAFQM